MEDLKSLIAWKDEAERELRRLRAELESKADANSLSGSEQLRVGIAPPRVSGVTVSQQVGTITVRWNGVGNKDLRYYEVQIADNANFASAVTDKTSSLSYQWDRGEAGTTYYARVRAVTIGGATGPYSSSISSGLGTADTANIEPNAASELATFTQSSGFSTLNTNGASETYGPVTVVVPDDDTIVLPAIVLQADLDISYGQNLTPHDITTELLRRPSGGAVDTVIDTAVNEPKNTFPTVGLVAAGLVLPAFASFDQPGAGTWEYRVRLTVNFDSTGGFNDISLVLTNLVAEFTISKR